MQQPDTERVFAYRVDADDKIASVNSDWLSFACENQASHLSAEAVVGLPLFRFVTDRETQLLYRITAVPTLSE